MKSILYQTKYLFLVYYRSENYRRLIPLLFLFAIFLIPESNDYTRSMVIAGGYRGYFNSAWVGVSFACSYNAVLTLMGYYLIKDRGEMLKNLKTNHIIGSTMLEKKDFIYSVFLSKFLLLLTTLIPMIFMAFIAQFVRGESNDYNFIQLIMPFIVFTVPFMLFITALTCVFDSIFEGNIGNVIYFFAFFLISSLDIIGSPVSLMGASAAFK